jgi:two-component system sensor histidine kinase UhpB
MSLRIRLTLISTALILIGMLLGIGFQAVQARQRVTAELDAAADLTLQLLDAMLPARTVVLSTSEQQVLLQRLQDIEAVRHLDIRLIANGAEVRLPQPRARSALQAPDWFVRLLNVPMVERVRPLTPSGAQAVLIRSDATAEIGEVWQESRNFLLVLLLMLLSFNAFLYFTIGRWLAPVQQIVAGLEQAEQGDFDNQVNASTLPELQTIADKLNQLTAVLRSSKAENERLTRLSLQIQEEERRNLARELHDEMGQSISAVKAIAWSLLQRLRSQDQSLAHGAEKIGSIATEMSGQVRAMLSKLRPAILDELGLVPALQWMVQEWNDTHKACHCQLVADPQFPALNEQQRIHLYRIVQEALTNVARHAQASRVQLELQAGDFAQVSISDNGKGFDPQQQSRGRGLAGMRERCQVLGGQLLLASKPGAGVRIVISFQGIEVS